MTTSICCLNHLPIPSNKISNIPTNPPPPQEARWWRRECIAIGIASCCTIVGLELKHGEVAIAKEEEMMLMSVSVGVGKWSEKRTCLPWRGNSLETIVPENLPRPATRRRYEDVHSTSKIAPPLSNSIIIIKRKTSTQNCFSM